MKYYNILIAAVLFITACSSNKEEKKEVPKMATVTYVLATVAKGGVATAVKLPAQLVAYQEVSIFPKVNGYVKNVLVDIGSKVSQGSLLMTLEAPELAQAALQAKEKYARSKADLSIDKERYQRLLEASKTEGAISPLDLSTVKAKIEADSALCNAEKANWQMQQTMLGYLQVTAPFAGVIVERNVSPGTLVSASVKDKPMLELKQIERLRLQADVPENMAIGLKTKDSISFYVSAFPGKKMVATVSRISENINTQYRNERIEMDVWNKDGALSPGMFANVVFVNKGNNTAMNVLKSAVVASTERKYVLLMQHGKVSKVDVITGNATASNIEVFGALQVGDRVIAQASDEIKEGVVAN